MRRSDFRARRTPPPLSPQLKAFDVLDRYASGASTFSSTPGLIRRALSPGPGYATADAPFHLLPRLSREYPCVRVRPRLRGFGCFSRFSSRSPLLHIVPYLRFWLQTEPFFLHKFSTVTRCRKGRFALRVPPFFASLQKGNHPCFLQLITTALLIVRKNRASAHKSNFKISQIWHVKLKNQPRTSQQPFPPQSKLPLP